MLIKEVGQCKMYLYDLSISEDSILHLLDYITDDYDKIAFAERFSNENILKVIKSMKDEEAIEILKFDI